MTLRTMQHLPSLWDPPPAPHAGTTEGRFERFHAAHPEVYARLVGLARRLRARGFEQYSIKGLFEIVRFEQSVREDAAEEFALNNDYTPLYARLIMEREADLAGFFVTRERRAP